MGEIALSAAHRQALRSDESLIFLATMHPPEFTEEFGTRVRTMPIAENAMIDISVGLAVAGMRPLVNIARVAFLFNAMDALVNQATKLRYLSGGQYSVPLTIRALTRGGESLGGQHEHLPLGMFAQIPGLVIAVPSSDERAAELLVTALQHPDPVLILESPELFKAAQPWDGGEIFGVPFGKLTTVRKGTDITLLGIGRSAASMHSVAERLGDRGVDAELLETTTVVPFDMDGLAHAVEGTGALVVVDDEPPRCSFSEHIVGELLKRQAVGPGRARALTAKNAPAPFAMELQSVVFPTESEVLEAAEFLARSSSRCADDGGTGDEQYEGGLSESLKT